MPPLSQRQDHVRGPVRAGLLHIEQRDIRKMLRWCVIHCATQCYVPVIMLLRRESYFMISTPWCLSVSRRSQGSFGCRDRAVRSLLYHHRRQDQRHLPPLSQRQDRVCGALRAELLKLQAANRLTKTNAVSTLFAEPAHTLSSKTCVLRAM